MLRYKDKHFQSQFKPTPSVALKLPLLHAQTYLTASPFPTILAGSVRWTIGPVVAARLYNLHPAQVYAAGDIHNRGGRRSCNLHSLTGIHIIR